MLSWHINHLRLHELSSSSGVHYSSEHNSLLLLLSHPMELSKTNGQSTWVTCLLKIWICNWLQLPLSAAWGLWSNLRKWWFFGYSAICSTSQIFEEFVLCAMCTVASPKHMKVLKISTSETFQPQGSAAMSRILKKKWGLQRNREDCSWPEACMLLFLSKPQEHSSSSSSVLSNSQPISSQALLIIRLIIQQQIKFILLIKFIFFSSLTNTPSIWNGLCCRCSNSVSLAAAFSALSDLNHSRLQ